MDLIVTAAMAWAAAHPFSVSASVPAPCVPAHPQGPAACGQLAGEDREPLTIAWLAWLSDVGPPRFADWRAGSPLPEGLAG